MEGVVTRFRIKLGPQGSVIAFQPLPGGEDVVGSADESKKRGRKELDQEVQAKKKQKPDSGFSSQCFTLLRSLMEHRVGRHFSMPVDPVMLNIPDYLSVISKPMDLGTIKSKLLKNEYSKAVEFAADVRLTFSNAMLYNPPGTFIHISAKELKEIFEVRWESLKKKMISGVKVTEGSKRQRSPATVTQASSRRYSAELPKPKKEKPQMIPLSSKLVKTQSKKDTLAATLKALATKKSRIMKHRWNQGLGISSAVKIPNKGLAPTAACKCDLCGRVMCNCLKSGNNSLGSDASTLTDCHVKNNTSGSQASESDPKGNGSVSSRKEKHGCVSSQLDKPSNTGLLDNELKTVFPALPPFSPERALRAAMLKSKYAGIIQKAQGIILHQSDKADLIRIQMEKEQIERTQREEKARIEAEMRDAKIAARMMELKEQRERERLKLEKMKADIDLQEKADQLRLEEDFVNVFGCSTLTRARLLFEEWGLVLRNDDCPELEESKSVNVDAMAMAMRDDLEEGEIDPSECL